MKAIEKKTMKIQRAK